MSETGKGADVLSNCAGVRPNRCDCQDIDAETEDFFRQRYEGLIQNNPDGIVEVTVTGEISTVNPAYVDISGFSEHELVGRCFLDFIQSEEPAKREHQLASMTTQVFTGAKILRHKSGKTIHVYLKSVPIVIDETLIGAHLVVNDVTTEKHAQDELRNTKEELQMIFESLDIALWMQEFPSGQLVRVSPGTEKIWGVSLEILMKDAAAWYDVIHPDDVELVKVKMGEMDEGNQLVHDYRVIHPNGQVHWVHERVTPIMTGDNKLNKVIGVAVDITELKTAQAARNEAHLALRRSDQLSLLGQLAAGIAHEIRNPLTSLMGFIQFMQPVISEYHDYFDIMISELNRINSIVGEFLLMAKPHPVSIQSYEVPKLITDTVALIQAEAVMQNIVIRTDFADPLPPIACNENQMKQVFLNLIKNALEAMPDGGDVNIAVKLQHPGQILISIQDEGCGIPADVLARIGQSFFTTKKDGTGLGMMVTNQIIESYGGRMRIESCVGEGTTVCLTLPITSPIHAPHS